MATLRGPLASARADSGRLACARPAGWVVPAGRSRPVAPSRKGAGAPLLGLSPGGRVAPKNAQTPFSVLPSVELPSIEPLDTSVEAPETDEPAPSPRFLGLTFQDIYYWLNCIYWGAVLVAVASGSERLRGVLSFPTYTLAMCGTSALFALYYLVKTVRRGEDGREGEGEAGTPRLASATRDAVAIATGAGSSSSRGFSRYGWNALFWAGFVAWAVVPPSARLADAAGPAAVVAAGYGALLAASSAAASGTYAFLGGPRTPGRLVTSGPYAIMRHPQTLGNFLFLVGFALAGGAHAAACVFVASFALYLATIVPRERLLALARFGERYRDYSKRVPAFRNGFLLLAVVEAVALWRLAPWAGSPV